MALIIVVFSLVYGGSGNFGDRLGPEVAEVNGEIISQREFAMHYERAVERYREMFKGSLDPGTCSKVLTSKAILVEDTDSEKTRASGSAQPGPYRQR